MLHYLSIEDRDGTPVLFHETPTRALADAQGLAGVTAPRVVAKPRPGGQGTVSRTKNRNARIISLNGEVWGSSELGAEAELTAIAGVLADAVDTPRLCRYQLAVGGVELQTLVRLETEFKPDIKGPGLFVPYTVSVRADEPRAFSQAVYTARSTPMGDTGGGVGMPTGFPASFLPSAAGQAVATNDGSASTPPVFRLYGRLVNPRVRLMPDGPEVAINGTVAAGHFLELDAGARTVRMDGDASRLYLRDFADSRWFDLPRGTSTLRLFADDADAGAYMDVFYRRAFG